MPLPICTSVLEVVERWRVYPALKERPKASYSRRRVTAAGGAGARIAVLGSENPDLGFYPTAEPCSSVPLQRILDLRRGLYVIYTVHLL